MKALVAILMLMLPAVVAGETPAEALTAYNKAAKSGNFDATWELAAKFKELPEQATVHFQDKVRKFIKMSGEGWDLTILEEKVEGDCALVIINQSKKAGEKSFDIDPVYLIKQDGKWRVFPEITRWRVAEQVAKDKVPQFKKLDEWWGERELVLEKEKPNE